MSKQTLLKQALVVALLGVSASAMAGEWQVKVGASILAPEDNNGVVAGAQATVSNEPNFTPAVEYFFANSPFSVELLLALPFKHAVELEGLGEVATFKHLPPTLTAKYNFKNSTRFTPYVGVGATVVVPWDEETKGPIAGNKLEADITYGVAGQVGFNFQPADATNWGVYADVRYAQVESDLELNGADIGTLEVNPWVYSLGFTYKF